MHCKKNKGLEEMTVTFASISLAELTEIIGRLNALPWVSAASLRVTTGSRFPGARPIVNCAAVA